MYDYDIRSGRSDGDTEDCPWCRQTLGPAYLTDRSVCTRCVDLLRSANIPDTEIFAGIDPDTLD